MYCPTMPHYDESFIHDDNLNQKRNKRSYRVYKNGLAPMCYFDANERLHALEERPTSVIKRNLRNIKQRGQRYRVEPIATAQSGSVVKNKSPDIFSYNYPRISVFDPNKLYDIQNNNIPPLSSCKSFDNLTLKKERKFTKNILKNGISLQNLSRDDNIKHYISPADEVNYRKADVRNSYSVSDARRRPIQRRISRSTAAPGVGIYRKINGDSSADKKLHGMII